MSKNKSCSSNEKETNDILYFIIKLYRRSYAPYWDSNISPLGMRLKFPKPLSTLNMSKWILIKEQKKNMTSNENKDNDAI